MMRATRKQYVPVEIRYSRHMEPLNAEMYKDLVTKAREGDHEARNDLIEGWLPLANSIASTWAARFPSKSIDLYLSGALKLCEAVDAVVVAEPQYEFEHASRYVHVRVRGSCIMYVRQDFLIRPPKYSEGVEAKLRELGSEWLVTTFSPVSMEALANLFMAGDVDFDDMDNNSLESPIQNCLGRNDPNFDFIMLDLETSGAFSPKEIEIVHMRLAGFTQGEIARALCYTQASISIKIKDMGPRIRRLIAGRY